MPMYKLKSPDAYPSEFHTILEKGFQDCLHEPRKVHTVRWPDTPFLDGSKGARREQSRFDAFRVNLRKHPLHRLHKTLVGPNRCVVRCELVDSAEGFYLRFKFSRPEIGLEEVAKAIGFAI